MKGELTLSRYVVVQYVPDTDYVDIFKIEAENFKNARERVERCVQEQRFSELVVLTDAQFVKLARKIKGFLGDFEL